MKIIKQTSTQLIFDVNNAKAPLYLYWSIIIAVNTIFIFIFVLLYSPSAIIFISMILFVVDVIFLKGLWDKYTVAINKSLNTIEVKRNNEVIYLSHYSIKEIRSIKTVVSPNYSDQIICSLVIVLNNHKEDIIDTVQQTWRLRLPFYIDIHANRQAEIGKKTAEFLGIAYQDSVYTIS